MLTPSYSNLSVIVVDDVRAMRALLKGLLRNIGIQNIAEASDGSEALKILSSQRKDLVVTDFSMAPMNGTELTRHLRQPFAMNAFTPVLMISGYNESTRIREAVGAGVSAFLLKPVMPNALAEKVALLLGRPTAKVQSPSYHGPDRRRQNIWVRHDRRSALSQASVIPCKDE